MEIIWRNNIKIDADFDSSRPYPMNSSYLNWIFKKEAFNKNKVLIFRLALSLVISNVSFVIYKLVSS